MFKLGSLQLQRVLFLAGAADEVPKGLQRMLMEICDVTAGPPQRVEYTPSMTRSLLLRTGVWCHASSIFTLRFMY